MAAEPATAATQGLQLSAVPMPRSFLCPITMDVMQDPVATVDGQVYERAAIVAWFRSGRRTSPATKLPLWSDALSEERALRRAIEAYLTERPDLAPPAAQVTLALRAMMAETQAVGAAKGGTSLAGKLIESATTLLRPKVGVATDVAQMEAKVLNDLEEMVRCLRAEAEAVAARRSPPSPRSQTSALTELSLSSSPPEAGPQIPSSLEIAPLQWPPPSTAKHSKEDLPTLQAKAPRPGGGPLAQCAEPVREHKQAVVALKMLSDGRLASAGMDKEVKLWEVEPLRCVATLAGHTGGIWCIAELSPGVLASGSLEPAIKIWDLSAQRCIATLPGQGAAIVALAPVSGNRLVSASIGPLVQIWDLTSQSVEATLRIHERNVWCLVDLGAGRLASCSSDRTVTLWDPAGCRGECAEPWTVVLSGHSGGVRTLIDLGFGWLASGSEDMTIKIWDSVAEVCDATLRGHTGEVWGLALVGDGRIASCSVDMSLKLWHLSTRTCVATLRSHDVEVWAVVCVGGSRFASGCDKGTVRIWDADWHDCNEDLRHSTTSVDVHCPGTVRFER